ncbi:MAG: TM2 domain protein [Candidatus Omnitrophica bacterium ADurb.Bin292]|mgnify:FL=1|jgi:hypothetical protein|nr:MAG: TM2 domain protein [Candidatus Omnitrophica bacterium ADurb.Bin292]HQB12250.1 hypothetical protein [Candidatus Omnitrophota bacterium]
MNMKNKWIALVLSFFVPGMGQIYLGDRTKGLTLLCVSAGLAYALVTSRSLLNLIFLAPICLFVMVPSAVDAYQVAVGKPRKFTGDSVPYVVFMLLVVGPFAVPLLWQSSKFSRFMKVAWTILVILIAIAIILFLRDVASVMDSLLGQDSPAFSF